MHIIVLIGVYFFDIVLLEEIIPIIKKFKEVSDFLESSNNPTFPYIAYCYDLLQEECEPISARNAKQKIREILKSEIRSCLKNKFVIAQPHYNASVIAPHLKLKLVPNSEETATKESLMLLMSNPEVMEQAETILRPVARPTEPRIKRSKTASMVLDVFDSSSITLTEPNETTQQELDRYLNHPVPTTDLWHGRSGLTTDDVWYADILGLKV
jgi:hypothetical protein